MLGGARRDDAETASGACADPTSPSSVNYRRVDLVLAAIAVDRRTRSPGDNRTASALERTPYQSVDEWVLERRKRRLARRSQRNQPVGIVAPRVRHGQQHRQLAARLMDGWGWELAHDQG
jgi:hypothetical protein